MGRLRDKRRAEKTADPPSGGSLQIAAFISDVNFASVECQPTKLDVKRHGPFKSSGYERESGIILEWQGEIRDQDQTVPSNYRRMIKLQLNGGYES